MIHAKSNAHPTLNTHWQSPRHPTYFVWDIALVVAIVLSLAFLATRVNATLAAQLADWMGPNPSAETHAPMLQSNERANAAELTIALRDPSASVRASAAQTLGAMRAASATDALIAATYDADVQVRTHAAAALGEIGALGALPRLQELEITQGNIYVETAAFAAEGKIAQKVASALNIPVSAVQSVSVAKNGTAYAAALNDLYVLRNGEWQPVSYLPATPNDLSVGPDGQLIFMSTVSSGLYRSEDGGETWEHLAYGLQTPTQLTVTAVVVNPENVQQIYIALAVNGSTGDQLNGIGIASSQDGGKTWTTLPDSPTQSVTAFLVIDQTTPHYLYGLSDAGPWRYQLMSSASSQ